MPPSQKTHSLMEFKGTTLPVVVVTLRTLQADELARAAEELFGDDPFFDGEAAVLELSQVDDQPRADWRALKQVLHAHGVNIIGVHGGSEQLRFNAAAAGLPTYTIPERPARTAGATGELAPSGPPRTAEPAPPEARAAEPVVVPTEVPMAPPVQPTVFIDRPLRSGQQVYARGSHLVILGAVNAGAEVIADGSIHIYAPLRGRALAGAAGATGVRIFCTRFDAELVSIAGLYRTFDGGVPDDLAGKAVQVRWAPGADGETDKLIVEALSIG